MAIPIELITLPITVASTKFSVIATGFKNFSTTQSDAESPNAAYKLFVPKLPPIYKNAKENKIIFAPIIIIPVEIPKILLTTSANPDIPPAAISFG